MNSLSVVYVVAFFILFIYHRVCSHWRRVAGDHHLFIDVDLTAYNIPEQQLQSFAKTHFGRSLTTLQLKGYETAGMYTSALPL